MYILFLKKLKKWFLFNYYNFCVKELCKAIILVVIDKLGQIHELLFYYGEYTMNHNINYQYENIKLQPIKKNDIEYFRKWRNEKKNNIYLRQIGHITSYEQRQWYDDYLKRKDELGFCIKECNELNRIVGSVFLYGINGKQAEFGRFLVGDAMAHGKKIGLNACYGMLHIGFEVLDLENITLRCYKENLPAMKIYKKVGFKIISENEIEGKYDVPDGIEYFMKIKKQNWIKL